MPALQPLSDLLTSILVSLLSLHRLKIHKYTLGQNTDALGAGAAERTLMYSSTDGLNEAGKCLSSFSLCAALQRVEKGPLTSCLSCFQQPEQKMKKL